MNDQSIDKAAQSTKPEDSCCPECGSKVSSYFNPFTECWKRANCDVCAIRKEQKRIFREIDIIFSAIDTVKLSLGFSPRHLSVKLDHFPDKMRRLHERTKGLFCYGSAGSEKTLLAHALADAMILEILNDDKINYRMPRMYLFPLFISVPDLLLKIKRSFRPGSEEDEAVIVDQYANCHTLFLDDIGAEKPSDFVLEVLFMIIDRRYRNLKKTYCTSNLSLKELSARLDDRIASRLGEMCDVIFLSGPDRRLKR